MWWANTLLRHFMLVFPLIYHPYVRDWRIEFRDEKGYLRVGVHLITTMLSYSSIYKYNSCKQFKHISRAGATHRHHWIWKYIDLHNVSQHMAKMAAPGQSMDSPDEQAKKPRSQSSLAWEYFRQRLNNVVLCELWKLEMAYHSTTNTMHEHSERSVPQRFVKTAAIARQSQHLLFTFCPHPRMIY